MGNKYDIFISYRREGGYDTAKHLNDLLVRDGYKVSFDIDTLRSGDFDTQLLGRIDQCKDFILIVDQHTFDRTLDPSFNPKNDWLRCELAYALKRNKNIIPIFLSGTNGFPENLPSDVAGVAKKNGPEYNRYHFNAFYEDLKSRFLKSRSNKYGWLIGLSVVIVLFISLFLYLKDDGHITTVNESTVDSLGHNDVIESAVDITYFGKKNDGELFFNKLYAKVDGYDYQIDIPEDICFDIAAQIDFDKDGKKDALITNIQACGGNAIGNSFFFVTYMGNGFFNISNSFGNSVWGDPFIEEWKEQKSVVIFDNNDGINTEKDYSSKERYVLKQGKAIRVEFAKKNSIVALQEIKASDFHNGKEEETIRMSYDLDGNSEMDYFECRYWDRWDALLFDIILNGNRLGCDNNGVSRVGVLSTKTNGMHDIICNENDIVKWNGTEYVFK